MSHFYSNIFSILFAFASVFLIFIVLLQRGRGGGLAGAFGATGGQSAFGTKAGDVFTRITIGVAVVWVSLAAATTFAMRAESAPGHLLKLEATDEPEVVPALPPGGAGAATHPFEAGDQGTKNAPATKGAASPKESKQPAAGKTTPPAKNPPATDTKGSTGNVNKEAPPSK